MNIISSADKKRTESFINLPYTFYKNDPKLGRSPAQ